MAHHNNTPFVDESGVISKRRKYLFCQFKNLRGDDISGVRFGEVFSGFGH